METGTSISMASEEGELRSIRVEEVASKMEEEEDISKLDRATRIKNSIAYFARSTLIQQQNVERWRRPVSTSFVVVKEAQVGVPTEEHTEVEIMVVHLVLAHRLKLNLLRC